MRSLLHSILSNHAEEKPLGWLEHHLEQIENNYSRNQFYFAFSGACRHFDKEKVLGLTQSDLDALAESAPGFTLAHRAADHVARTILLLALANKDRKDFLEAFHALLGAADIREAVVLYSSLALLPYPEELILPAREGTRTNVVDMFDAIALENPFPSAHFDEEGWNQMVLKCLFINRPLHRVIGLEERANPHLAHQISDLAHERWAAGRELNPEAWRCCLAQLDNPAILADLASLADRSENERRALALVYAHNANAENLAAIKDTVEPFLEDIETGNLTWETLGETLENA